MSLWCWIPALLLMSTRFDPRPECFSLLFTAVLLAVLLRVDVRPAWAWALPVVMFFWVNTHSLFAIGIVVTLAYLFSRLVRSITLGRANSGMKDDCRVPPWSHLVPASVLAGIAPLANPYGISGALFPLELLPKITDPSNAYRDSIDEVMSLQMRLQRESIAGVSGRVYVIAQVFLLMMLPLSFIFPAVWRRLKKANGFRSSRGAVWGGTFSLAAGLVLIASVGLPGNSVPGWLVQFARFVPPLLALGGLLVSTPLFLKSGGAGILAAAGAFACACMARLAAQLPLRPGQFGNRLGSGNALVRADGRRPFDRFSGGCSFDLLGSRFLPPVFGCCVRLSRIDRRPQQ